jgi:hypothetical protein
MNDATLEYVELKNEIQRVEWAYRKSCTGDDSNDTVAGSKGVAAGIRARRARALKGSVSTGPTRELKGVLKSQS